MKIRVVSDLHVDINNTYDFGFMNDKECNLTIIAGDIAGDYVLEANFLNKLNNKNPVIVVGGNHLGYIHCFEDKVTKEYCIRFLQNHCTYLNKIHYLENFFIDIGEYVVYGGTMYTDFNLYDNPALHKRVAEQYMNDFRYVYTEETGNRVTPEEYTKWFHNFILGLKNTLCITNKDIIVVSHFAPSVKSISNKYNGKYKELNPAYASNLEQFIKYNPRIKLWLHGHMHDNFDYKIGQCRVVCAPYGYIFDSLITPEEYMGKKIILRSKHE